MTETLLFFIMLFLNTVHL